MGVIGVNMDSQMHSSLTNTKRSSSSTLKPCSACNITRADIGDGRFDMEEHRRAPDGIDLSLQWVNNERNKAEKKKLSKEVGVVDEDTVNPLCKHVHMNVVRQIGSYKFHQDSIVRFSFR